MIDWTRVEELRAEVGPDDFQDVVALFLAEVEETLARLRDPAAAALPALEGELHALKGSALNLGFGHLSALCAAGERLAARGRGAEVDLAAIARAFAESRDALRAGPAAA